MLSSPQLLYVTEKSTIYACKCILSNDHIKIHTAKVIWSRNGRPPFGVHKEGEGGDLQHLQASILQGYPIIKFENNYGKGETQINELLQGKHIKKLTPGITKPLQNFAVSCLKRLLFRSNGSSHYRLIFKQHNKYHRLHKLINNLVDLDCQHNISERSCSVGANTFILPTWSSCFQRSFETSLCPQCFCG